MIKHNNVVVKRPERPVGSKNQLLKTHFSTCLICECSEYLGALSGHGPQAPSPLPLSFNKFCACHENFVTGTKFILAWPKEELRSASGARPGKPIP
jgi:hypothetical protein